MMANHHNLKHQKSASILSVCSMSWDHKVTTVPCIVAVHHFIKVYENKMHQIIQNMIPSQHSNI